MKPIGKKENTGVDGMKYARLKKLFGKHRQGKAISMKMVDLAQHLSPLIAGKFDVTDREYIEICYLAYSPHKKEPSGVEGWLNTIKSESRQMCREDIHDLIKEFYNQ